MHSYIRFKGIFVLSQTLKNIFRRRTLAKNPLFFSLSAWTFNNEGSTSRAFLKNVLYLKWQESKNISYVRSKNLPCISRKKSERRHERERKSSPTRSASTITDIPLMFAFYISYTLCEIQRKSAQTACNIKGINREALSC